MIRLPPVGGGGGDVYTGCVLGGWAVVGGAAVVEHVIVICCVPVTPPAIAVIVALPAVAGAEYRAVNVPLVVVPEGGETWPAEAVTLTAVPLAAGALAEPTRMRMDAEPL